MPYFPFHFYFMFFLDIYSRLICYPFHRSSPSPLSPPVVLSFSIDFPPSTYTILSSSLYPPALELFSSRLSSFFLFFFLPFFTLLLSCYTLLLFFPSLLSSLFLSTLSSLLPSLLTSLLLSLLPFILPFLLLFSLYFPLRRLLYFFLMFSVLAPSPSVLSSCSRSSFPFCSLLSTRCSLFSHFCFHFSHSPCLQLLTS